MHCSLLLIGDMIEGMGGALYCRTVPETVDWCHFVSALCDTEDVLPMSCLCMIFCVLCVIFCVQEPESEELKELRAEAEAAAARANMTFDENWQAFLKAVYDTELVPTYAVTAIQLGCSLLQLLAHEVGDGTGLMLCSCLQSAVLVMIIAQC